MARKKILKDKTQIIEAARRLIETDGIEAISMIRLSKELGVSSMTLYNYVRNADEVLREILILTLSTFFERLYIYLCERKDLGESAIHSYAISYSLALYDLAKESHDLCLYLISAGHAKFHQDAELRPFYEPFPLSLIQYAGADLQLKNELNGMFRGVVFSLIYEHLIGSNRLTKDTYLNMVSWFVDRM